jgi:drug/metabolite transporter (DMT)-like permease
MMGAVPTAKGASSDPARQPHLGGAGAERVGRLGGANSRVVVGGGFAQVLVGAGVAASATLLGAPYLAAESIRYALASAVLAGVGTASGQRLRLPRGAEWLWLTGVAALGLVVFNVALVKGSASAAPAALGVAVACVPPVLSLAGPLMERRSPSLRTVAAACLVTVGSVAVVGLGHTGLAGVGWAVVVFACEVAFTLLAVPVLGRHRAWGVSVHATWMGAVAFGVLGLIYEGPGAFGRLQGGQWAALAYLAFGTTVAAFLLWYSCVSRIGAARAGLLTGMAPVAAAVTGVILGGPTPSVSVVAGIAIVLGGLGVGFAW